ncbi:hypothetical protein ACQEVB_03925 [Pseudonocardia sp. CA-107938]|uniref:hypothetical protein n=1 Tax=Pseudonocardia sp. CA-107938 TaxID=3240021 RepID=UPI003D8E1756
MRSPLRQLAAAQHGAFSTAQALLCYSPGEVRARLAGGHWVQVFSGSHRLARAEPNARLRTSAAGLSLGREVPACLHTAAELHGFGVLLDPVTHVAVPGSAPLLHRAGLWPHQLALGDDDLTRLRCGIVATTAERTAVDLARTLPRLDALPVLDAALAAGVCTQESLASEVSRHAGLRGVRQARELVPLACEGPESPPESRLRLLCHDAKLPPPTVQHLVTDGRARRWIDLAWEEAMVGLEHDGEVHDGPDRRRSDRRRHNWFQNLGWTMFYATDADTYGDPARLLAQVAAAVGRRSRAKRRSA